MEIRLVVAHVLDLGTFSYAVSIVTWNVRTPDTSILTVLTVVVSNVWTRYESGLISCTDHIVQKYLTSTLAKECLAKCLRTCYKPLYYSKKPCTIILLYKYTIGWMAQLSTNHSSISYAPKVITHCSPLIANAYLNSAFSNISSTNKTNITIKTTYSEYIIA